jgi:prolipoprotein diacylglyceryltransferase
MHSTADVIAGAAVAVAIIRADLLWGWLRRATERIANSWREWRIGRVRIINHGFYAGAGTFVAYTILGAIAGAGSESPVFFVAVASLVGAGAWAQWIEGSPRLLRPYGFYGGVFGTIIAALLAQPLFRMDPWVLISGTCVAAPWLQSLGRLRCLVQGCCHGAPAGSDVGIRFTHPRSRVTRLAGLTGVPVHPTQLYSILSNGVIAAILIRFWTVGAPLNVIAGVYLILMGGTRFVEEAYRGEPQTPVVHGLRLYQWIAIASMIGGAIITAVCSSRAAPAPVFTWGALTNAAVLGVIASAALGLDFPESNRRFARLT